MSSNIGKSFKTSLFGESHNKIIGVTINNIAPGINLDLTAIENDLSYAGQNSKVKLLELKKITLKLLVDILMVIQQEVP